jgi:hypothetical protein
MSPVISQSKPTFSTASTNSHNPDVETSSLRTASLADAASHVPTRTFLQRALSFLSVGAPRYLSPVSTSEIAHRIQASRESAPHPCEDAPAKPKSPPPPPEVDSTFSLFSLAGTLSFGISTLNTIVTFLAPRTSVVYIPRREAGSSVGASGEHSAASHASPKTPAAVLALSELSPPHDHGPEALGIALEHVAQEIRRERSEDRSREQARADEELRRKRSRARDAVNARDLQNGIRNAATEEIIDQLEGPFAISVETALARVDELNRSEKQ